MSARSAEAVCEQLDQIRRFKDAVYGNEGPQDVRRIIAMQVELDSLVDVWTHSQSGVIDREQDSPRLIAAEKVMAVVRELNNPKNFIWHDCKGPTCRLCVGLPDALADYDAECEL